MTDLKCLLWLAAATVLHPKNYKRLVAQCQCREHAEVSNDN